MRYIILLLVVAGACSRSETSAPEEAATSAAEAPPDQPPDKEAQQVAEESAPAVDLDTPPAVELLDPGKPPRKALRATFEPGTKEKLQLKSDWVVSAGIGPMVHKISTMPLLVYELETETKESTKEGTRFGFRVTKIAVKSIKETDARQVEPMKTAAASLQGVTGGFSINARGMVEAFAIEAPTDANLFVHDMINQIERAIRLTSLPLPEEPVGKGATWTASQLVTRRGARSRQTSTVELLSVKGQRVRAKITIGASTPKQRLRMPGSPPDSTPLQLDQLDFEGQGKGSWLLDRLAPSSASEELATGFMMMTTSAAPEVVLMGVRTEIEVKAAP